MTSCIVFTQVTFSSIKFPTAFLGMGKKLVVVFCGLQFDICLFMRFPPSNAPTPQANFWNYFRSICFLSLAARLVIWERGFTQTFSFLFSCFPLSLVVPLSPTARCVCVENETKVWFTPLKVPEHDCTRCCS